MSEKNGNSTLFRSLGLALAAVGVGLFAYKSYPKLKRMWESYIGDEGCDICDGECVCDDYEDDLDWDAYDWVDEVPQPPKAVKSLSKSKSVKLADNVRAQKVRISPTNTPISKHKHKWNSRQVRIAKLISEADTISMPDLLRLEMGVSDRTLRRDMDLFETLGHVRQQGKTRDSFYQVVSREGLLGK